MATWPSSLPSQFEIGAQLSSQQTFLRSQTDKGPFKQRRRFTARSRFYSGTMLLTATQKATLETFFEDDANFGGTQFDFEDPADLSTVSARFVDTPSYQLLVGSASGVELQRVSFTLELLPS